jgi:hypothetical protein
MEIRKRVMISAIIKSDQMRERENWQSHCHSCVSPARELSVIWPIHQSASAIWPAEQSMKTLLPIMEEIGNWKQIVGIIRLINAYGHYFHLDASEGDKLSFIQALEVVVYRFHANIRSKERNVTGDAFPIEGEYARYAYLQYR